MTRTEAADKLRWMTTEVLEGRRVSPYLGPGPTDERVRTYKRVREDAINTLLSLSDDELVHHVMDSGAKMINYYFRGHCMLAMYHHCLWWGIMQLGNEGFGGYVSDTR